MQTKKSIIYRTHKKRLKTNSHTTSCVESLEPDNHMWIELGIMARNLNVPFTASSNPSDPYPRSILTCVTVAKDMMAEWENVNPKCYAPISMIRGAIMAGIEMKDCLHLKDGKTYPIFFLGAPKRIENNMVWLKKSDTPFSIVKGSLPDIKTITSHKIVDITNDADRHRGYRQFELHLTVQKEIPDRRITGLTAGVDVGKLTAYVVLSDGTNRVLRLYNTEINKHIRKLQSERDRCMYDSNKWNKINARIKIQRKALYNWQLNEYRHFCKKLCVDCDIIKFENLNLINLARKGGNYTKGRNRTLKESKAGEMRDWCTKKAPEYNTEIREVRPYNTSKQCHACQSKDTERYGGFKTWHNNNIIYENWSHDRKFRCRNCGNMTHADYNGAFNIMYSPDNNYNNNYDYTKPNSRRAQKASRLCIKSGSDLRDRINLRNRTPPPVVNDWQVVKTALPKRKSTPNKLTLNGNSQRYVQERTSVLLT